MGRLTKEEQAKRDAALANANTGATGTDSNVQQPQTNTPAGELDKASETEQNADKVNEGVSGDNTTGGIVTGTIEDIDPNQNFNVAGTGEDPKTIQTGEGDGQEKTAIPANADGSANTITGGQEEGQPKETPGAEIEGILMTGEEVKHLQEAGVIDADLKVLLEGPELFKHLDAVQINRVEGVVTEEEINNSPLFTFANVEPGDNQEAIRYKVTYKRQMDEEVTEQDLIGFPELAFAGIVLGMTKGEAMELLNKFVEENPDAVEAIRNGTYVPLTENKGAEGQETGQEDEFIYHGDFLEEHQLGKKVTYDWNEVTAPEHLPKRPEVSKKPESGLPPIIEA